MQELSVVSLNIERDLHTPAVLTFLSKLKPDVVMLQEIFRHDLPKFEAKLAMQSVFTGLNYFHNLSGTPELGVATFSRLPIISYEMAYYRGDEDNLPTIDTTEPEKMARALVITELSCNMQTYCFANTHFTWSPHGQPNDQQFVDCKAMLEILDVIPEFVLCGDFNAPRGRAIFAKLASRFKDNIPAKITTTIDGHLHKAGNLNLVVDGLFTTPGYRATNVEVIDGVSDHCAIVGKISKV